MSKVCFTVSMISQIDRKNNSFALKQSNFIILLIEKVICTTAEEFNREVKADMMPFVFKEEGYLYPIQQEYLNKNPKLVQNPNW